jgi:hypothetical protein
LLAVDVRFGRGVCLHGAVFSMGLYPSQQRRDLDTFKLEELKREIGVLEKEFDAEVQKRTEMGSTLHTVRAWEHSFAVRG